MYWVHLIYLLALPALHSVSATPDPQPEPYRPFFPPNITALDLNHRAISPIDQDKLLDRAKLANSGDNFIRDTRETSNWRRNIAPEQGQRSKGQGKRGSVRTVIRRAVQCVVTGLTTTSPTAEMTVTGGGQNTPITTQTTTTQTTTTTMKPPIQQQTTVVTMQLPTTTTTTTQSTPTTTTTSLTTTTTTSTTTSPSPQATSLYTVDPSGTNGPFSGWGTWFDVGLGACGWYNNPGDPIVAISAQLFDNWPGYTGWNPNNNPICGLHLNITWGGKWAIAEVADECPGCAVRSLDMSKGLFEHFATLDVGLLGMDSYTGNISWSWVSGTGGLPSMPYTP